MSESRHDALRRSYRQRRRALEPSVARDLSAEIAAQCLASPAAQAAKRIGSYIAMRGEVQTAQLNRALIIADKQLYAPVVRGKHMVFCPLQPPLRRAQTGNLQPQMRSAAWLSQLDIVLLPLLAFDDRGNRLGMGGGYYDRLFASRLHRKTKQPLRVGLAFDCQQAERLPMQAWDVPLHAVVTESGWRFF